MQIFKQSNSKKAFKTYYNLQKDFKKAKSSALIQTKTGKIGLRAFLFERKVPRIVTPLYEYRTAEETVAHLLEGCSHYSEAKDL